MNEQAESGEPLLRVYRSNLWEVFWKGIVSAQQPE
jgi:hypothetical protein